MERKTDQVEETKDVGHKCGSVGEVEDQLKYVIGILD